MSRIELWAVQLMHGLLRAGGFWIVGAWSALGMRVPGATSTAMQLGYFTARLVCRHTSVSKRPQSLRDTSILYHICACVQVRGN